MAFVELLDTRLPDHFWSKVAPCPMSGCWLWTASVQEERGGYAQFRAGGTMVRAHRYAFKVLVDPVLPDDVVLDHECRVTCCVNPAHLEAVPQRVNLHRGNGWSGRHARKTTCPKGHPYDAKDRRGQRFCTICRNERQRANYGRRHGLES